MKFIPLLGELEMKDLKPKVLIQVLKFLDILISWSLVGVISRRFEPTNFIVVSCSYLTICYCRVDKKIWKIISSEF